MMHPMEFAVNDPSGEYNNNIVNTSQIAQLQLLVQAVLNTTGLRVCPLGHISTDDYVPVATTGTTGTTGAPATTGMKAPVTTGMPESMTTGKPDPVTTGEPATTGSEQNQATSQPDGDLTGNGNKGTSDASSFIQQFSIIASLVSAALCLLM
jgi:hypothetical protein